MPTDMLEAAPVNIAGDGKVPFDEPTAPLGEAATGTPGILWAGLDETGAGGVMALEEAAAGTPAPVGAAVLVTGAEAATGVVSVTIGEPGQTGQVTVVTTKPDGT